LRGLLDLPGLEGIPAVYAEVASRAATNADQTLEIDRGADHGVEVGMPVVAAGSLLVGRVVEVSDSRSKVRLLSDPLFSVGVSLPEVPEYGLATGAGAGEDVQVSLVDDTATRPGNIVTSSGTDQARSLVPKGLVVGVVSDVEEVQGELSLRVRVRPSVDLERLEFVAVLLWKPPGA
jgi:rod shape-determining protein MreC